MPQPLTKALLISHPSSFINKSVCLFFSKIPLHANRQLEVILHACELLFPLHFLIFPHRKRSSDSILYVIVLNGILKKSH